MTPDLPLTLGRPAALRVDPFSTVRVDAPPQAAEAGLAVVDVQPDQGVVWLAQTRRMARPLSLTVTLSLGRGGGEVEERRWVLSAEGGGVC